MAEEEVTPLPAPTQKEYMLAEMMLAYRKKRGFTVHLHRDGWEASETLTVPYEVMLRRRKAFDRDYTDELVCTQDPALHVESYIASDKPTSSFIRSEVSRDVENNATSTLSMGVSAVKKKWANLNDK